MSRNFPNPIPVTARILLSALWGSLCAAQVAAPVLAGSGDPGAASLIYALFARVCHQIPGRSFFLCGYPLAVCHRCFGIYLGLLIGSWLPFERFRLVEEPGRRRLWVLGAAAPLFLDACLQFAGWPSTAATRLITGLIFGAMLSSLLVPAVSEIVRNLSLKRNAADSAV